MKAVATPCPSCPFTRGSTPGELGGSPPEAFVGQAQLPFALPCHQHCDFDDPTWKTRVISLPQCAGAASFRTHIGAADGMPAAIPILPANASVFSTAEEFLAHHMGLSLETVKLRFSPDTIHAMAYTQWRRAKNGERP